MADCRFDGRLQMRLQIAALLIARFPLSTSAVKENLQSDNLQLFNLQSINLTSEICNESAI
jgi:hypothetical protein